MPPTSSLGRRVRAPLLPLADRLESVPLALVSAPAGSGKTTLLAAWRARLAAREEPSAALELTPLHADAAILLADLLAAIRASQPGFGAECERTLAHLPGREEDWRLLARAFLRDRAAEALPLVAMLDGYHELPPDSSGARLVDDLLRAPSANLRWVIATRGALPGAAARLRAADALLEVDADQLALRAEEIEAVFAERGVEIDPALATRLLARTGGWATGVQLAARRLEQLPRDQHEAYVDQLTREPDLFGFVAAEVLRDEPDALGAAVEIVALLGECAPEDVAELTGDPGAPKWIERAVERGVLRAEGTSVRVQPLWREVLRERARTRRTPAEHRALLLRAGRLLRRRERFEPALEAFAEAEEWQALADALIAAAEGWLAQGRGERLRYWLGRLPPPLIERSAPLLAFSGVAAMQRAPEQALPLLERAARDYRQRGDRARERQLTGLVALLQLVDLQREDALRSLRRLISLRGLLSQPAERGSLLVLLAGRSLVTGRFGRSLALSERAAALPLEPHAEFLNAMNLGLLRGVRGEWERGLAAVRRGLEHPQVGAYSFTHWSLRLFSAQILARSGEFDAASAELSLADEALADYRIRWLRELVAQEAGFVASRQGDRDTARRWFDEAAARAGGGTAEPVVCTVAAIEHLRWGEADLAGALARRALELTDRLGSPVLAMAPWWRCFALWVLGRAGDAGEAWRLARPRRREFDRPELRLAHHAMQTALADLALRAGDADAARQHATAGLAVAEREGLRAPDPWIGELAIPAVAELALREDLHAEPALTRLAATAPARVAPLLAEQARDPDASVRLRTVALLGRHGGREAFEPLRETSRDPDAAVREAAQAALAGLDLRPWFVLRVRSLGGLAVSRGEEEVAASAWKGQTARRLFARLLVAEGRPVPREQLLADLWPDIELEAARNNLRVATARLNEALDPARPAGAPPHFVLADDESLRLHPTVIAEWDATAFRAHLAAATEAERRGDAAGALAAQCRALDLYGGPLLADVAADWIEPLRRELAQRFAAAGHRAGPRLVRRGRLDEALVLAERLLRADPADEQAFALRMRAQLAGHDRAGALRSYEEATAALRRELDLEPGEELRRLAGQARGGA